jgi:uncharacterized membrane protein YphA (DoxX/SURF4 family)
MKSIEIGTLVLRIYLGLAFVIHGLAKFQGGVGNTAGWFDSIGIPGFMAYVVAAIELFGGLLLVVGLGTRYISALLFIIMISATIKVKLSAGFMGSGQGAGYELDIAYAVIALFLFLNWKTSLSLDSLIVKRTDNNTKEVISEKI